jgi:YfiH family protein
MPALRRMCIKEDAMTGFHLAYCQNGIWCGFFKKFEELSIKHGVSTRLGGSSTGPFASLNLGLHTGDDAEKVKHNRQRFSQAAGVDFAKVTTAEQIHGDKVVAVTAEHAGLGALEYNQAIRGVDALITNVPGVPLMLFFADCVPILIADPVHKAIGISHAGWKGTVAAIAAKTVRMMENEYGTRAGDCIAGIGPSIGQCCYEVDEVVVKRLKEFPYWKELVRPQANRWQLDLWEANRRQLITAGVLNENIIVSGICTACNTELFFSYRAENGYTGRIGAVISL